MRQPVAQKDICGCAVACVAFILNLSYEQAINLFEHGKEKSPFQGFYCREIITALEKAGKKYRLKYIGSQVEANYPENSIIFIKKCDKYPMGHFLCHTGKDWMDPWINFPKLWAKSGFSDKLPGKPNYIMVPD